MTAARSSTPAPRPAHPSVGESDRSIDHSRHFVMPGLIDVHTHLAYGNAKSEEDIDLYSPLEFRTLRGMFFAQKVAAAGFTAICSPGDAGQISLSIRNAIRAGLFDGPRVMAAGRYLTTHQGLTDWYPTWIGAPETSIGKLVNGNTEAVEEIRRQVKDGVDCVKIALDGIQRRDYGELVAAFTQEETDVMVREIHRLGKKGGGARPRPRGDALRGARRGRPDLSRLRPRRRMHRGDEADRQHGLADPDPAAKHVIDFTQPHEPAASEGPTRGTRQANTRSAAPIGRRHGGRHPDADRHRYRVRGHPLRRVERPRTRAVRRRSRLLEGRRVAGGDRGQRPVHGRHRRHRRAGAGPRADFIAWDGSPLADIRVLQDKRRLRGVYIAGREITIADRPYDPRKVSDFALCNWTDLYTQERVAELRRQRRSGRSRVGRRRGDNMDDIARPYPRRLYEYWSEKRGDRGRAGACCIDPLDMIFVVGNVILVDVLDETPPRFRIRLHGTNLSQRVSSA